MLLCIHLLKYAVRDQRAYKKSVATIIYDIYIQIARVYETLGESGRQVCYR